MPDTFYGKYRGTVVNNLDPLMMGRVEVTVPAVFPDGAHAWAMPCAPAGFGTDRPFVVPAVGSRVWVEFEQGDPALPIWSGIWWDSSDEAPRIEIEGSSDDEDGPASGPSAERA